MDGTRIGSECRVRVNMTAPRRVCLHIVVGTNMAAVRLKSLIKPPHRPKSSTTYNTLLSLYSRSSKQKGKWLHCHYMLFHHLIEIVEYLALHAINSIHGKRSLNRKRMSDGSRFIMVGRLSFCVIFLIIDFMKSLIVFINYRKLIIFFVKHLKYASKLQL